MIIVTGLGVLIFFNLGKITCLVEGGKLAKPFGPRPFWTCTKIFKDADKECTDGSQCEGKKCIAPEGSSVGAEVKGRCVDVQPNLGCYATVRGGKAQMMICAD